MVNGPGDRMTFVGMGELTHPGKCMVCGSGMREEGYVRLGVYFEYEGEMFLCVTCVEEAGSTVFMLTKVESRILSSQSASVNERNAWLEKELDTANERLAGIDAYLRGSISSDALPDFTISPTDRGSTEQGTEAIDDADESVSVEDSPGVSGVPDFDGEPSSEPVDSNAGISL